MSELVQLLFKQGHRQITFIGAAIDLESEGKRRRAFVRAMEDQGLKAVTITVDWADSYDQIMNRIKRYGMPTAFCCWNDATAYQMLAVCRACGVRVPEDVSLTGFDGLQDGQFPYRRPTTCKVPWSDMSAAAVNSLMKMRSGEKITGNIVYKTTLQAGDTVAEVPEKTDTIV